MRSWTATVTRRGGWAVVDVIVVTIAVIAGLYISSLITGIHIDIKFTPLKFIALEVVLIASLIATSAIHLKTFRRWQTYRDDLRAIIAGSLLAGIIIAILFMFFQTHYKPLWIALSDAFSPAALAAIGLALVRAMERSLVDKIYNGITALFVEIDPQWYESLGEIRDVLNDDWRLAVISLATKDEADGAQAAPSPHALPAGVEQWDEKQVEDWLRQAAPKGHKTLFVFGQRQPRSRLHNKLIEKAYGNSIPITNMIDFHEEILEKSPLFETESHWYSSTGLPRPRYIDLALKRLMDLLLAIPIFIITLPLVLVLGYFIRKESPGPAIFRQTRVGLGGKEFTLYKLRSMTMHEDDSDRWPNFEANKVTRMGKMLRDTGLDELPQIINVIKGDMSFVGPRPARPKVTRRHIERLPYYAVVKSVKPGISGWAQLHQGQDAGDDTMFEKTRFNLYYAKHFSIWLDMLIYIRTFSQLLLGKKRKSVYLERHQQKSGQGKGQGKGQEGETR